MVTLIKKGEAPAGAMAPTTINLSTFWMLDVDDPIWQDAGLLEDEPVSPPWLTDNKVRSGIRAMLEIDRCTEELARISRERGIMQHWLREEWEAVESTLR